jgi:hypothetical protein
MVVKAVALVSVVKDANANVGARIGRAIGWGVAQ